MINRNFRKGAAVIAACILTVGAVTFGTARAQNWHQGGQQNDRKSGGQRHMQSALQELQAAQSDLQQGRHDDGGHRDKALDLVGHAISEVQQGIGYH